MYDIINYKCPYCGKETSTQTKLSSCELENLSIGDFFIVGDLRILMKNPCEYCNNKSIVIIENGIIKRFDKEEEGYNESELIFGIIEESKSQNGNKNEMKEETFEEKKERIIKQIEDCYDELDFNHTMMNLDY